MRTNVGGWGSVVAGENDWVPPADVLASSTTANASTESSSGAWWRRK